MIVKSWMAAFKQFCSVLGVTC